MLAKDLQEIRYKSSYQVFQRCAAVGLGGLVYGYAMSELAILYQQLELTYGLPHNSLKSNLYQTAMVVAMSLGAMIISFVSHSAMRRVGRRVFMIISDCVLIVGSGLSLIPYPGSFIAARFIIGVAVGMNSSVIPLYIREISPDSIAGITGQVFQVNINVGIFLGIMLCFFLLDDPIEQSEQATTSNTWKIIVLAPIVFAVLRLVLLNTLYKSDTPYYYYSKGKNSIGRQILGQIYKEEFVMQVEKEILMSLKQRTTDSQLETKRHTKTSDSPNQISSSEEKDNNNHNENGGSDNQPENKQSFNEKESFLSVSEECLSSAYMLSDQHQQNPPNYDNTDSFLDYNGSNNYTNNMNESSQQVIPLTVSELRKRSRYRRFKVGLMLNFFQQLTGVNVVIQYSGLVFQAVSPSWKIQTTLSMLSNVYLLLAAIVGGMLNRQLGRKNFLFGGYAICGSLHVLLAALCWIDGANKDGIATQLLITVLVFLFFGAFNCSVGPVTWIYTSDILKGRGLSASITANWAGNVIVSLVFIAMNDFSFVHVSLVFAFFAASCFVASVLSMKTIIETEGKSFKEIIKLYAHQR